jgi:hypothetical protein
MSVWKFRLSLDFLSVPMNVLIKPSLTFFPMCMKSKLCRNIKSFQNGSMNQIELLLKMTNGCPSLRLLLAGFFPDGSLTKIVLRSLVHSKISSPECRVGAGLNSVLQNLSASNLNGWFSCKNLR